MEHHTFFARAERVEQDELSVEPNGRAGAAFDVGELTVGYRHDFRHQARVALGIGAAGILSQEPRELRDAYGKDPTSAVVCLHVALHLAKWLHRARGRSPVAPKRSAA